MLYPQYDLKGKLAEAMRVWRPGQPRKRGRKLSDPQCGVPHVREHWERLAAGKPRATLLTGVSSRGTS